MGLEQILDIAYKATFPIRAVDKTVKLGYDALAAATSRAGFNRFNLAMYTAIGTGAAFLAALGAYSVIDKDPLSPALFVGSLIAAGQASMTVRHAYHFLTQNDVLSESDEREVQMMRFFRLPILAYGAALAYGAVALTLSVSAADNNRVHTGDLFYVPGLIGVASHMYLIDGDHSLWDKAKAKVKQAYNALHNLIPKPAPLPQPQ